MEQLAPAQPQRDPKSTPTLGCRGGDMPVQSDGRNTWLLLSPTNASQNSGGSKQQEP